jgi:hypothetical protein
LAANAQSVFQGVMGLALVETDLDTALHVGIEQPVDGSVPTKVRGATSLIAYMPDVTRFLTFLHPPNVVVL